MTREVRDSEGTFYGGTVSLSTKPRNICITGVPNWERNVKERGPPLLNTTDGPYHQLDSRKIGSDTTCTINSIP